MTTFHKITNVFLAFFVGALFVVPFFADAKELEYRLFVDRAIPNMSSQEPYPNSATYPSGDEILSENPIVSATYFVFDVSVFDADTDEEITDGGAVQTGQEIIVEFTRPTSHSIVSSECSPYYCPELQSQTITWSEAMSIPSSWQCGNYTRRAFCKRGNGWFAGACTSASSDTSYVGIEAWSYTSAPISLTPTTYSVLDSDGLSCSAVDQEAGTVACTVTGAGEITPSFRFASTQGKWWTDNLNYQNLTPPASCNSSGALATSFTMPAQTVGFTFDSESTNSAPNAPEITGPTSGVTATSYNFGFSATDPDGNNVRYGIDWNNNGTVDEWAPASGYVSSGTGQTASHAWASSGGKTFQVLAQDTEGSSSSWSTHTITISNPPAPTADLSASPSSITEGESSTLTWSSANADSCSGTGFSTGGATSGDTPVSPTDDTTYTVTCSGDGGDDDDSATVTVTPAPPEPTASLSADPTAIDFGDSSTLSWSSTNASSCTGSGFSTGGATSGSEEVSPSETSNYGVTCTGEGGEANAFRTVSVYESEVDISAASTIANVGASVTISWSATDVDSCTVSGPGLSAGGDGPDVSGNQAVTINAQSTFVISCETLAGSQASDSVEVKLAPLIDEF